jgi:H+/gluconate symporter-like permease
MKKASYVSLLAFLSLLVGKNCSLQRIIHKPGGAGFFLLRRLVAVLFFMLQGLLHQLNDSLIETEVPFTAIMGEFFIQFFFQQNHALHFAVLCAIYIFLYKFHEQVHMKTLPINRSLLNVIPIL